MNSDKNRKNEEDHQEIQKYISKFQDVTNKFHLIKQENYILKSSLLDIE